MGIHFNLWLKVYGLKFLLESSFYTKCKTLLMLSYFYSRGGGGGGGALRYRGGPHLSYVFRGRRGLFLRPPHVRDLVKEGYFFYQGTKYGDQNPLTIHEIYAALTPSDSRSDWASESSAATCCR